MLTSTLLTWPIHHSEPRRIRDNLPKAQRRPLRLKQRHDIVIKSADKGSATLIMDRKWYLDECYRQLNNPTFYEQQDTDLTDTIQKRVTEYVKRMLNDELIDKKKTNNTYYIRILNPNASIFSLKSMKSIILSLFTDPLFLFKVVRSWELVRRHVTLAVLLVRIMRLLTRCVPWEYLSCLVVRYTTFLATRNVYGRPLQGRQRKGRLRESCPRLGSWTSATKVKIGAITSSV